MTTTTTVYCSSTMITAIYEGRDGRDFREETIRSFPERDGLVVDQAIYEAETLVNDVLCGRFDERPVAFVVNTILVDVRGGFAPVAKIERVFDLEVCRLLTAFDDFMVDLID